MRLFSGWCKRRASLVMGGILMVSHSLGGGGSAGVLGCCFGAVVSGEGAQKKWIISCTIT